MTRMLAFGAASAAAFARSRTMLAFVLKRSKNSIRPASPIQFSSPLTITSHARLSRNTRRDQDDFTALETFSQTRWSWIVALDSALGVDVADISCHTCIDQYVSMN
jgi:hypothetical protein